MSVNQFVDQFGGWTEAYKFYNGEVELRYDPKEHVYLLVTPTGLERQEGVTTIVHIIDKSEALIGWACKMMATKLLSTTPVTTLPTGDRVVHLTHSDYESLVLKAKTAHRDKLEEAASIGSIAHAWIEAYIERLLANNFTYSPFPENEQSASCCVAALAWMRDHNVRWVCTEKKVYSRHFQYAGTMDGLCIVDSCTDPLCCPNEFRDHLSVADWKTSNYLYPEYLLQTAAYEAAYEEEHGVNIRDRWVIRLGKDDGNFEAWHLTEDDYEGDITAFLDALNLNRSYQGTTDRIKLKANAIKAARKAEARQVKEAALKVKCKSADKYKGTRKPTCNGGNPCHTCIKKYEEAQREKIEDQLTITTADIVNHEKIIAIFS